MRFVALMLIAQCAGGAVTSDKPDQADDASDGDTPSAASCDGLCLSTDPERQVAGRVVATLGGANTCIYRAGFADNEPAQILIDGVQIGEAFEGGDGELCLNASNIPDRMRSGQLWMTQGGEESNRLSVTTPPWITEVTPDHAASGDEVTVTVDNVPVGVSWDVQGGRGCTLDVLSTTGGTVVVVPLWNSVGERCSVGAIAGVRELGASKQGIADDAPGFDLDPVVYAGCHARVGEACSITGTGFGRPDGELSQDTAWLSDSPATLSVGGHTIVPEATDHWRANEVRFTVPDLPAGDYTATGTRADGTSFETTVRVQRWERTFLGITNPAHRYGHEGSLVDIDVGYSLPNNGVLASPVVFAIDVFGSQQARLQAIPNPGVPTVWPLNGTLISGREWGDCSRTRVTGIRNPDDLLNGSLVRVAAGRVRGPTEDVDWDGMPSRSCEPSGTIDVAGEDGGSAWTTFGEQIAAGDHPFVAGLARIRFDTDPPVPDPDGRPGRDVPILAVADTDAVTTTLYQAFGGPLTAFLSGPIAGIGTLHEAGEILYLAGGEPGYTGVIHEITWSADRSVPHPDTGLDADDFEAFSGAPDGTLWTVVAGDPPTLYSWSPDTDAWTQHSQPAVTGDIVDLAVFQDAPFVATLEDAAAGNTLRVFGWDGSAWTQVHEDLAGDRYTDFVCLPYESDDKLPGPECPAGTSRFAASAWRPAADTASDARFWATSAGLYLRYRVDDDEGPRAYVAALHEFPFGDD